MHAEDLRRLLAERLGRPVYLRINDNFRSVLSVRRDGTGPGLRLSVHRMFLDADTATLEALVRFAKGPTDPCRVVIRDFINRNIGRSDMVAHAPSRRQARGTPRGRMYNLEERAAPIHERHFGGQLDFRIAWGKGPRRTSLQSHVTLGTWNLRQRLIRIHPMLDHPNVPGYFLDFVIYHEMIHVIVPSRPGGGGRIVHHPPEFRRMERRFPLYREAMLWEKRWISALLADWAGLEPLPADAGIS